MKKKLEIETIGDKREFEIELFGEYGRLYETGKDTWSMQLGRFGGFCNWHTNLDDALIKAEDALRMTAELKAKRDLRIIKKQLKNLQLIRPVRRSSIQSGTREGK